MDKLFLLFALMGVLAKAQVIKPKGEFEYSGAKFYLRDISTLEYNPKVEIAMVAFKIVDDKNEHIYFVLDEQHNVLRFYSYKDGRWYDVKSENKTITIKYYF